MKYISLKSKNKNAMITNINNNIYKDDLNEKEKQMKNKVKTK